VPRKVATTAKRSLRTGLGVKPESVYRFGKSSSSVSCLGTIGSRCPTFPPGVITRPPRRWNSSPRRSVPTLQPKRYDEAEIFTQPAIVMKPKLTNSSLEQGANHTMYCSPRIMPAKVTKWRLIDDQPWRRAYVVLKPGTEDSFVAKTGSSGVR